jgi:hypothetical protein
MREAPSGFSGALFLLAEAWRARPDFSDLARRLMTEAFVAAGRRGLSAADALSAGDSCAAGDLFSDRGAVLVDRLIDLLLALEPFEIKQSALPLDQGAGDAAEAEDSDAATPEMDAQTGAGMDCVAGSAGSTAVAGAPGAAMAATGAQTVTQTGAPVAGPAPEDNAAKLSVESTRAMLARMRTVLDREAGRLGEDGLEGKAAVDQVALIARTLEKIDQMERLIAEDQARTVGQRLGPEEREQLRQTVRQLILAAAERLAVERAAGPEDASEAAELGDAAERGEGAVEMSDCENVAEDFSGRTEAETR